MMIVMKKTVKTLCAFAFVVLTVASCVKYEYSEEAYHEVMLEYFPVESVSSASVWDMCTKRRVTLTSSLSDIRRVQVLSTNPYEDDRNCEILAEGNLLQGQSVMLLYYVPKTTNDVCFAALDEDGRYIQVITAVAGTADISFDSPLANAQSFDLQPQKFYYCFEENYPEAGDWDYNDLVLGVSMERTSDPKKVKLNVELHAVGSLKQLAAAINLVGYDKSQIRSVTVDGTNNFVHNADAYRSIITSKELLLKGKSGEAVINLFDDAHAAFTPAAEGAPVTRYYYNTVWDPSTRQDAKNMTGPVTSYIIEFLNASDAQEFGMANLDPFVALPYITVTFEIHTRKYKLNETLFYYYNGQEATYNDEFSFAIEVPYRDFYYPQEAMKIGTKKGASIGGCFAKSGASFGEWLQGAENAKEWYKYPTGNVMR
ncbi:MAG: LruC domain-containing protein [Prevotella sp.]|nr:LruC domain-containing protein [Prevotella sp.]